MNNIIHYTKYKIILFYKKLVSSQWPLLVQSSGYYLCTELPVTLL